MDLIAKYRMRGMSRGYLKDPSALIHPMILIGAGASLTPEFAEKNKITHVINCAEDEMCPSWFPVNFPDKYTCLSAVDALDVNIIDWYPKFKSAMQTYLQDPSCKRVYVHCQCGINRSAFLAMTYVCDVFGYNYFNARESILKQRPCALTNSVFSSQVYDFLTRVR
jgi:hypothetical protein